MLKAVRLMLSILGGILGFLMSSFILLILPKSPTRQQEL